MCKFRDLKPGESFIYRAYGKFEVPYEKVNRRGCKYNAVELNDTKHHVLFEGEEEVERLEVTS